MKKRSELMTLFLLTMERLAKRRLTADELRSPEWKARRDAFVKLFEPVIDERERRV